MFTASAALYDAIYAGFKDYATEARVVASLLRRVNPTTRTVLDVACGTGEHARLLGMDGFSVDGLDLDPAFIEIASAKNPSGRFVVADMADFDLGARYDAVICLFSSIGYARTLGGMTAALRCFARHAAPGGAIVVEPWFAPGVLQHGTVMRNEADANGVHVVRTSRVAIDGRLSRLDFDYEITGDAGATHANEIHELGLFTNGEMLDAFAAAGLDVTYDPDGLTGRGLYVARREGSR